MRQILILFIAFLAMIGMAGATDTAITAAVALDDYNDYASAPSGWTTLNGNGSINSYVWPAGYELILMANVTGILDDNYLSIIAGDNPPAFRSMLGNMTISDWTDGGNEVRYIGPLESARFINDTGYLTISSLNLTGKVAILKVKG